MEWKYTIYLWIVVEYKYKVETFLKTQVKYKYFKIVLKYSRLLLNLLSYFTPLARGNILENKQWRVKHHGLLGGMSPLSTADLMSMKDINLEFPPTLSTESVPLGSVFKGAITAAERHCTWNPQIKIYERGNPHKRFYIKLLPFSPWKSHSSSGYTAVGCSVKDSWVFFLSQIAAENRWVQGNMPEHKATNAASHEVIAKANNCFPLPPDRLHVCGPHNA